MSIGSLGAISTGFLLVGAGTFALFTGTATNSGNAFTAGKVQISDVTGKSAFSQTAHFNNLAPGDSESANVSVQNTGNLDAWVYLDGPASIQTESGAVFHGAHPLAITFHSNPVLLHPGETKGLSVSYSLPRDAGNEYQNASGTMDIVIDAVQARDNTNAEGTGPQDIGSSTAGAPATIIPAVTHLDSGTTGIAQPVTFTVKDANGNVVPNSNVTVTVTDDNPADQWVGEVSTASAGTYGASATVATNASGVATVYFKPGANYLSGGLTNDTLTATDGTATPARIIYYHYLNY
jgi:spore coat-associated protein N